MNNARTKRKKKGAGKASDVYLDMRNDQRKQACPKQCKQVQTLLLS